MSEFKKYTRKNIVEIRPYVLGEPIDDDIYITPSNDMHGGLKNGDMIARYLGENDKKDQWIIREKYFKENYRPHKD